MISRSSLTLDQTSCTSKRLLISPVLENRVAAFGTRRSSHSYCIRVQLCRLNDAVSADLPTYGNSSLSQRNEQMPRSKAHTGTSEEDKQNATISRRPRMRSGETSQLHRSILLSQIKASSPGHTSNDAVASERTAALCENAKRTCEKSMIGRGGQ